MKQRLVFLVFVLAFTLSLAPFVHAQWVHAGGPVGGGDVTSVATLGTNVFAATLNGVLQSTDNGATWAPVGNGLPSQGIAKFTVSGSYLFAQSNFTDSLFESVDSGTTWFPANPYAMGPLTSIGGDLFTGGSDGVSISTDGGAQWSTVNNGIQMFTPALSQLTSSLGAIAASGNNLFISGDEIYRTGDGGVNWTLVDSDAVLRNFTTFATDSSSELFAGNYSANGRGHLYSSTDNGSTWLPASSGLVAPYLSTLATSGSNVFAGSWYGVSRSSDNGVTWTNLTTGTLIDSGINSLAVLGSNVFAGGYGIYRSSNNGATWKLVDLGLNDTLVGPIAAVGNALFTGSWSTDVSGYYQSGGIYRSTNNGATWVEVYSDAYASAFTTVGSAIVATLYPYGAVISTDNGLSWNSISTQLGSYVYPNLLAASGQDLFLGSTGSSNYGSYSFSLYRSTDGGTTWIDWASQSNYASVSALVTVGTALFAGVTNSQQDGGVFRSTDDGANWTATNTGLVDSNVRVFGTAGTTLFAVTMTAGVFRTTDNGWSWSSANSGITDSNVTAFASTGANIFAMADSNIFRSTDNGSSWLPLSGGPMGQMISGITTSGISLFASTSAGLYRSDDYGASWTSLGIISPSILSLTAIGNDLFAGGAANGSSNGGVFRSMDNGTSWVALDNGLPPASNVSTIATMGSILFAGGPGNGNYYNSNISGGLYRSLDLGASWDTVSFQQGLDSSGILGAGDVTAFTISGSNIFAGLGYYDGCSGSYLDGILVRSTDSGMTWKPSDVGLGGSSYSSSVYTLAANGADLYAVTGDYEGGVFQSEDNGADWYLVNSDLLPNSFAFIGTVEFAGGYFGVYRSMDSSVTWQRVDFGLSDTGVMALATDGNRLFAATPSGIFFSNDYGTRWKSMSSGLPQTTIECLLVSGNYLYAGTSNSGIWRRPLSDFPMVTAPSSVNQLELSSDLALSPNPSEGLVSASNAANVTRVSVLNLLGQSVLEFENPGASIFTLDLSKLPSGTYFARISVGGEVITKKIVKE
ncbi:MAG TPA: T9SS type A sorting domain-containing protein [Candidatus Kapabacteria bacterium]|nr:T9SS type A sorting domain-containing protein [Candidatus Kapabacteria bacterium]